MSISEEMMKKLLEAGVHFGHQKKRWDPRMKPFIFSEKGGIYIIDLQKTMEAIKDACDFLYNVSAEGGYVLFVGTKRQAKNIVKENAERAGAFYVTERWLGGTLTNFETIRKSVNKLDELEKMQTDGTFKALTKKEVAGLTKELNKLKANLDGIRKMNKLPAALFAIDSVDEEIAIKEAKRLRIPIVAITDTNANPEVVDYPIPGNDDAIRSIDIITKYIAESVQQGRAEYAKRGPKKDEKTAKDETTDQDQDNIKIIVEEEKEAQE